jgi:hypothetical protein
MFDSDRSCARRDRRKEMLEVITSNGLLDRGLVALDGAGRPREFSASGRRNRVTAVEALRDETAAYRLETGPRRVFVVRSHHRRYRLVHRVGDGSWGVEELPGAEGRLLTVA